ncbi:MAG: helix-turn-helix domain-containing protein [Planctomycetota bacterium]
MKKKTRSRTTSTPKKPRIPTTVTTNGKSDRLLTVGDVAERLGLSTRTIWSLRSAGEIPSPIKIGANTRWRRSDIETYIHGLRAEKR